MIAPAELRYTLIFRKAPGKSAEYVRGLLDGLLDAALAAQRLEPSNTCAIAALATSAALARAKHAIAAAGDRRVWEQWLMVSAHWLDVSRELERARSRSRSS